jgi:manganese efflux pump family protein
MQTVAAILVFGLMAGLDNFHATCALGLLPLTRGRKVALGVSFGVCESSSALAGLLAGHYLSAAFFPGKVAGILALLLSGTTILFLSLADRDVERAVNEGWMIFGLPLSLSLDNLVGGAGLGANGFPPFLSAILIGAVCSALSFAGILLGGRARLLQTQRASVMAGGWLLAIALISVI